jgi:hypothetical protein
MYWVSVASHRFKNSETRMSAAQAVDEAKDGDEIEAQLRCWLAGGPKSEMLNDADYAAKFRGMIKGESIDTPIFGGSVDGEYLADILDSACNIAQTDVSPTPETVTWVLGELPGSIILSKWRKLKTQSAQPPAAASSSSSSNLGTLPSSCICLSVCVSALLTF